MKTSFFKRGVAAFLALVLCAASIAGATSVYAVGEQAQVYKTTYPDVYKRQVYDRDIAQTPEERQQIMRQAFFCDYFLASSNAVSRCV